MWSSGKLSNDSQINLRTKNITLHQKIPRQISRPTISTRRLHHKMHKHNHPAQACQFCYTY